MCFGIGQKINFKSHHDQIELYKGQVSVSGSKFNTQHMIHTGCVTHRVCFWWHADLAKTLISCHNWEQVPMPYILYESLGWQSTVVAHWTCLNSILLWHFLPFLLKISVNWALCEPRLLHPCSSWEQELLLEDFGFTSIRLNQRCSASWESQIMFTTGTMQRVYLTSCTVLQCQQSQTNKSQVLMGARHSVSF